MKTPIAFYNLWQQGPRTCVSVLGVAFALLLVFMQLGFMGAVSDTATNVLEKLRFDIILRARDYLHLYEPSEIDRRWLREAQNTPGVASAVPLWITAQNWRSLPTRDQQAGRARESYQPQYLRISVMAFQPQDPVFLLPDVQQAAERGLLSMPNALLVDDSTHDEYGPWLGGEFSSADIGRETEIGGKQFIIQGLFQLGTGLAANGAVITSDQGFARITPFNPQHTTSLGLLTLEPGVEPDRVLLALRQRLSTSPQPAAAVLDVLSRSETIAREKQRWLWETPIGLIFQLGVLLALLVGGAIVYMVLSTDVADRLPEYATLLALGYSRSYLASIVMTQATVLAAAGFCVSWGSAEVLYRLTSTLSNVPLAMTPLRVIAVLLLGFAMCCISGLLALRKLWKAEPANLF